MARVKGDGSVYEYRGRVWYQESEIIDGKRRYFSGSGRDLKQARDRQRKNKEKFYLGLRKEQEFSFKLSQLLDHWLENSAKTQAASKKRYRQNVEQHVIGVIGDVSIHSLSREQLKTLFLTTLPANNVGVSAISHTRANLNTALNVAVEDGLLAVNPMAGLKIPKAKTAVEYDDRKFITRNTNILLSIIDWLEEEGHELYPLVLMLSLGLRISEVLGLEWECFTSMDSNKKATVEIFQQLSRSGDGELRIKKETKTKSSKRRIPLPPRHRLAINQRRKEKRVAKMDWAQNLVFLNPNGSVLRAEKFNAVWQQMFKDFYDVKNTSEGNRHYFRPHYCRHIAASLWLNSGTSIKTIADLLGHSTPTMSLEVYSHASTEEKRRAVEFLQRV